MFLELVCLRHVFHATLPVRTVFPSALEGSVCSGALGCALPPPPWPCVCPCHSNPLRPRDCSWHVRGTRSARRGRPGGTCFHITDGGTAKRMRTVSASGHKAFLPPVVPAAVRSPQSGAAVSTLSGGWSPGVPCLRAPAFPCLSLSCPASHSVFSARRAATVPSQGRQCPPMRWARFTTNRAFCLSSCSFP